VNWEAISAIGQIVGAIAVVVSLIYLATEVRRNTRASRLAAMHSMSDSFNRWIQQIVEHPHLTEVYYRGIHDFESLQGPDLVRFSMIMTQAFRNSEENFYLQMEGHVGRSIWRGWEKTIHDVMGYPGIQAWWATRSHLFSEEFAKLINQLQHTAKHPRWYREPMEDE